MENKVLKFEDWKNLLEEKKSEKESDEKEGKEKEKEEKNPLEDKVSDLSVNINDTVTFEKPKKLEVEDKIFHILSVTPNKANRKIKVTYKDESEEEKSGDFFSFHKDVQEPLYNLLKKNL
jgi:hypothetical protein